MVVQYSETAGFTAVLLARRGSVLTIVFQQKLFWFLVIVHAGVLVVDRYILVTEDVQDEFSSGVARPANAAWKLSAESALPQISWQAVSTLTALLTLFIVFFGTQAYDRMRTFYTNCVGLSGVTMNWTTLVCNNVPRDADGKLPWTLVRLILASQHVLFFTIDASSSGRAIDNEETEKMKDAGLLDLFELDQLKQFDGYKPYLPLTWALRELHAALVAHGGGVLDEELVKLEGEFKQLAFEFRGHCGQISHWLVQPVPFPYFQMLTLLCLTDLLAISYGLVLLRFNTGLTALIYVLITIMFLGLKGVAVEMAVRAPTPCSDSRPGSTLTR